MNVRRKDRERTEEFALSVVDKCEYAVMSVVLEDGSPYGVPLSIARDGEFIYFHCAQEGRKTDALKENSRVCLSCVGDTHRLEDEFSTEYESAAVFGTAEPVLQDEEKIHALRLICRRHTPMNMENFDQAIEMSLKRTAIWRIRIDQITGKAKKRKQIK